MNSWDYDFARKFSASRFEVVMRVFRSKYYRDNFGATLKYCLIKPANGNHAVYYVRDDYDSFADKVYQKSCQDLATFRFYINEIKTTQEQSLKTVQEIVAQPLQNLSWQELGDLWQKWDFAHLEHFLKPIWIPFIIEPLLSRDAQKVCAKHNLLLDVVLSPDQPNALTQERISLLKIALSKTDNRAEQKLIHEHTVNFGFIPCYDVSDAPYDENYFQKDLENLKARSKESLKAELDKLENQFDIRKAEFSKILENSKLSQQEKELLQMTHEICFIKDERDDYRRRISFTVKPLISELANRYGLSDKEPLYLIKKEAESWFKTGSLPVSKVELDQRIQGYCLAMIDGQETKILSGKAMEDFLAKQNFSDEGKTTDSTIVKGLVGNKGYARGRVALVITTHDLAKVRHNDILISVTTNPDYMPAMRKCLAFVTDEGGITCHAAIVSRELGKPCIIGTKIATKIFEDGDEVEVDATVGTVKKLSS